MKKLIIALMIMLTLALLPLQGFAADGATGDIDQGKHNGMGSNDPQNIYHTNDYGVRATLVHAATGKKIGGSYATPSFNYFNPACAVDKETDVMHTPKGMTGTVSKIEYLRAENPNKLVKLSVGQVSCIKSDTSMPNVIAVGYTNVEEVRSFFTDEKILTQIAGIAGLTYEQLTSFDKTKKDKPSLYNIIIEPMALFTAQGQKYCLTGTEAGLMTSDDWKDKDFKRPDGGTLTGKLSPYNYIKYNPMMKPLTDRWIPLGLFTKRGYYSSNGQVGITAYTGPTTVKGNIDTSVIMNELAIGVIKFPNGKPEMGEKPPKNDGTAYRYNIAEDVLVQSFEENNLEFNGASEIKEVAEPTVSDCNGTEIVSRQVPHEHSEAGNCFIDEVDMDGDPTGNRVVSCGITSETINETVPCTKSKDHIKSWKWSQENIVPYESFNGNNIFINKSDPMDIFKIVRAPDASTVFHNYNQDSSYKVTGNNRVYSDYLIKLNLLSSRTGLSRGKDTEIQLAAYMEVLNTSFLNLGARTFWNGIRPAQSYEGSNGYTAGGSFKTAVELGGGAEIGAKRKYEYTDCRNNNHMAEMDANIGKVAQEYTVDVKPTYKVDADEAKDAYCNGNYSYIDTDNFDALGNPRQFIRTIKTPGNTYTFNPTYKMYFSDAYGKDAEKEGERKDVWILAAEERNVRAFDVIEIKATNPESDLEGVITPWSRDYEDIWADKTRTNRRKTPTAKAGQLLSYIDRDNTIAVTAKYVIQDPLFVDPSKRGAVSAQNIAKMNEMEGKVNEIAHSIGKPEVYTNLWDGSSKDSAIKVGIPEYAKKWAKSNPKMTNFVPEYAGNMKYSVTRRSINVVSPRLDNKKELLTTERRNPLSNGYTLYSSPILNDPTGAYNVVRDVLIKNKGIEKEGWYNEEYEGIMVCTYTMVVKLPEVETKYTEIHTRLSDSVTKRNELAEKVFYPKSNIELIGGESPDKEISSFGVGLVCDLPDFQWKGITYKYDSIPFAPYFFGVRGNLMDVT